jgi:dolichol-phosphate mannosyltransferase
MDHTSRPKPRREPFDALQIVIPVYNEGDSIEGTLDAVQSAVTTPHRFWIVYDFDEDNTLPAVRSWAARQPSQPVELVKNRFGPGVLNALRTGFDAVPDGVVLVIMADLSDDMRIIDMMFERINAGYEIVCGSRYMPGGKQIGGPLLKGLLSRGAGLSLYYLAGFPTRDVSNSFKMYTTRVLREFPIESDGGFEIGMEILVKAHAHCYPISEIPSVWRDRSAGTSRFRLAKWLPKYLRWYWLAFRTARGGR